MKLLLYCTKNKPYLYKSTNYKKYYAINEKTIFNERNYFNGKIVGECDYKVEEIKRNIVTVDNYGLSNSYETKNMSYNQLLNKSCLSEFEILNYLKDNNGYAIYIKNLHIFKEPRELSDYFGTNLPNPKHIKFANWIANYYWALGNYSLSNGKMSVNEIIKNFNYSISIKKAPQNMCYCYEKVGREFYAFEKKVLIPIRPEWLCKILNGEKTIEIRKKVLKGMIKNE